MGANVIHAGGLWIEIKKNFCIFFFNLLVYARRKTATKAGRGKQDIYKLLIGKVVSQTERSDKTEIKKFFLKISGPPAEVAPAPFRGHPHTPSSAGGRWFSNDFTGMRWIVHNHNYYSLMIVDIIDIDGVVVFKPKNNSPISWNRHGPKTLKLAL